MFGLMQQVVHKYLGLDLIVTQVLERMGNVQRIQLLGDYAKGIDSGVIEINITGPEINTEYTESIIPKMEEVIGRRVRFFYNEEKRDGFVLCGDWHILAAAQHMSHRLANSRIRHLAHLQKNIGRCAGSRPRGSPTGGS